jgi:starch synthase
MEILHVSAECYPVAKVGGLGDVVGALPKYQNQLGHTAKVVLPMYRTKFLFDHQFDTVHQGSFDMGEHRFNYSIIKERKNILGFDLYLVDINGMLDRQSVYGYGDDSERFTAFQIAVVDWLSQWKHQPDIVHVHDHHAGLIPFMMKYCTAYRNLAEVATVLTIHNAQYQGWMGWDKSRYLPDWNSFDWGNLDWQNNINPLASAVKCARVVTTVSQRYLEEMRQNANGLEKLFDYEQGKFKGILNGIDTEVWDPSVDSYISPNFNLIDASLGKLANKKKLCEQFNLDFEKPLFIFIGRLVYEKAADLLPQVIYDSIYHMEGKMNFLVLGSGESAVEAELENMKSKLVGYYNSKIGYNEQLSHQMYAGADFLIMPSRVEPCGLNQMYAMRYGTIPLVRNTGGLQDTVKDFGEPNGYGICFNEATVWDITHAIYRALEIYNQPKLLKKLVTKIMKLDNSWESSAKKYLDLYQSIL